MTTQVKTKMLMWSEYFPLLDLFTNRSAIALRLEKLASLYLCTGFLICHECQWIC